MLTVADVQAQVQRIVKQGTVLKHGTSDRIPGAMVVNLTTRDRVFSNELGNFGLLAATGDTVEITKVGYISLKLAVSSSDDIVIRLSPNYVLDEVVVKGRSLRKELEEEQKSFRKKGVFYGGKPPLMLLIFKPLTFINESFGKNARQARRFGTFATRELEYHEVSMRFNDAVIKRTVKIEDKDLEDFKARYWPSLERVRAWSDYDAIIYIKKSHEDFLSKQNRSTSEN